MIIIAGTIDLADPSQIDEAIEKAKPLQQATRDDEPGCQAYVFSKDPCVAGRIAVYELWDDEASLAAHFKHENYLNMGGFYKHSVWQVLTTTSFGVTTKNQFMTRL